MDHATIEDPLPAAARRGGRTPFPNPVEIYIAVDRAQADAIRRRARRDRVNLAEAIRRTIADVHELLAAGRAPELAKSRPGPRRPTASTGLRTSLTLPGPLVEQLDAIARHVAAQQGEPDLLERTSRNELVRRAIQWSETQS